jgi:hypothetical protein
MQSIRRGFTLFFAIPLVIGSVIIVGGCEQKEKVIDIETPAGNIEVERTKGSGKVDVDIQLDRK